MHVHREGHAPVISPEKDAKFLAKPTDRSAVCRYAARACPTGTFRLDVRMCRNQYAIVATQIGRLVCPSGAIHMVNSSFDLRAGFNIDRRRVDIAVLQEIQRQLKTHPWGK